MWCIKAALLLSLTVSVSVCSGGLDAFRKHNLRLEQFPCKDPRPRVFELEDLKNEELKGLLERGLKNQIKPAVTVLHRCQYTGCCKDPNERCMPKEAEEVPLTFAFTDRTLKFIEVQAKNHTACACSSDQEDNDIK